MRRYLHGRTFFIGLGTFVQEIKRNNIQTALFFSANDVIRAPILILLDEDTPGI